MSRIPAGSPRSIRLCDENVFAVVIEAENERTIHLNAVVVQHADAPGVVGGLRRFFLASARLSSVSDSNPMKTPVQPASAMLRIKLGSSVTSIVTAALQIFSSGRRARHSARR